MVSGESSCEQKLTAGKCPENILKVCNYVCYWWWKINFIIILEMYTVFNAGFTSLWSIQQSWRNSLSSRCVYVSFAVIIQGIGSLFLLQLVWGTQRKHWSWSSTGCTMLTRWVLIFESFTFPSLPLSLPFFLSNTPSLSSSNLNSGYWVCNGRRWCRTVGSSYQPLH